MSDGLKTSMEYHRTNLAAMLMQGDEFYPNNVDDRITAFYAQKYGFVSIYYDEKTRRTQYKITKEGMRFIREGTWTNEQ